MDFRILGPLEVLDEGRPVALASSKQRTLLALFLLHRGETLSTDRLVEELWGERPPATAAKAVQVYISRLRKALADRPDCAMADLLVTRDHGYQLELEPERLDADRFERLVAEGRSEVAACRPRQAAAVLEEALSLWRGPPLADLAYEPFAQHEIARLSDLRVAALEQLIEAKLALGAHAEVLGQLEALIAEQPYRERLRGQLMLALYRCDRQADALQAYQDARRTLVEDLGIEPGERLRELERAILAQDPGLRLVEEPAVAEPTAAAPRGAFVGRERELAELVAGLDDAFAGRGRLLLLVGEPGIGKSRLAEELIAHAGSRGARVLIGRCWEAGGAPAYWPWVQSLRGYVREVEPNALRAQLSGGAPDLAQILPELREHFPDLPQPAPLESDAARFRLFDAAAEFLRRASGGQPIVLVLDDLHAADAPSLLLLRFLARHLTSSRILLLAAYRDVDPIPGQPLTEMLVEVAREPVTRRLPLGGLSERDVADYIELSTGVQAPPRLARAIHAQTEGNPLFVAELVRLLDAEDRIAQLDTDLLIPQGVRAVIARRVARLPEPCRNVLINASVIGREFGLDALAELSRTPPDELLDVLDEAMDERVLGDVPGSPGRLRFSHALIRDTLYGELNPGRRLQLHKNAAEALETVYSDDVEAHLTELAHHFFTAAPIGVADKAVDYARRAGDRAAGQLAYEEAVRLYEMALTLAGGDLARCELLLVLGDAQARGGDTPAAQQSFLRAADLAESLGLPEQLARAALGYGGRIIWEVSRGDVDHAPLLERALAALGEEDSPLRVRLLARLAGGPLRDASFPPERKRSLSGEALEMARRIGDPATLSYALSGYITAHQSPPAAPQQVKNATELIQLAREAGDRERAAEGHESRAVPLLELGDMQAAKADFAAMARLAEELRQPSQDWLVAVAGALVALLEGELAEAERLIARARGLAQRVLSWNAAVSHGLQLYALRREQSRLEEVEELVRRSVEAYPTYPVWRCVRAQMASELGNIAEARDELDALAADGFAGMPFDEEWLLGLGLLSEAAAALEDVERAADLYQLLLPYGDRVAASYMEISIGAVARYLGLLAATIGRLDDAERHFRAALEMNQRIGARPWLARTQVDYARMLLARAAPGDHDMALELLADARGSYLELGMDTWAQRAWVEDQPPKSAAGAG